MSQQQQNPGRQDKAPSQHQQSGGRPSSRDNSSGASQERSLRDDELRRQGQRGTTIGHDPASQRK